MKNILGIFKFIRIYVDGAKVHIASLVPGGEGGVFLLVLTSPHPPGSGLTSYNM